jgi:hypothetical protein
VLPARTDPIWFQLELGAHLWLWVGLTCLLVWWLRQHPEDRPHVAGALVAGAAWIPAVYWWIAPAIPLWAYTPMREGYTLHDLQMAAGAMAQNGVLVDRFWRPTFIPPTRSGNALDVLRMQLGLGGLAVLLFWPAARRLSGSTVGALVVTLVAALNPNHVHALLSETEAPTAAPYLVASLLPFAILVHPGRSTGLALLATSVLATATAILGTSRLDLMGPGLTALVLGWTAASARARAAEGRWQARYEQLLEATRRRPILLVLATVLWLTAGTFIRPLEPLREVLLGELYWIRMAIDPLNPTWASLPVHLAASLPLGALLLLIVGAQEGLRRPLRTGGLAITVFILWGAYHAAGHGGRLDDRQRVSLYELYRYTMLLAPVWWVWMARGWSLLAPGFRDRPRWSAALATALCLTPPLPEATGVLLWRHPRQPSAAEVLPRWGLVDRDPQRQVRLLHELAERHPDCGLLTWSAQWGAPPSAATGALVLWRPSQARRPLTTVRVQGDPTTALQGLLNAETGCVLWLDALDCQLDLPAPTPCDLLRPATEPLLEQTWPTRPFLHPEHGATWRPQVRWSARPFPGRGP